MRDFGKVGEGFDTCKMEVGNSACVYILFHVFKYSSFEEFSIKLFLEVSLQKLPNQV